MWRFLFFFLLFVPMLSFGQYKIPKTEEKQEEQVEPAPQQQPQQQQPQNKPEETSQNPSQTKPPAGMTEIEPSPVDKIWVGGTFNLGFGVRNGINVFALDLSPHAEYEVVKNLFFGAGIKFLFTNYSNGFQKEQAFTYGPAVSARYAAFSRLLLSFDYQYLNVDIRSNGASLLKDNHNVLALGIGYRQQTGNRFAFFFMFQHDFLLDINNPIKALTYPYPYFVIFNGFNFYYTFGISFKLGN